MCYFACQNPRELISYVSMIHATFALEEEDMSIKNDSQTTTTREVFRLLEDLRGQHSLEPVKKLFWTELNYDHAHQTLSRRDWPEKVANVLSEDPLLFATAGDGDNFHVIYARLAGDKLSLDDERQVVNQLLKNHIY